ncbi:MAG: GGDEF domain-containing protein [Acidobacteriota bacterium]
MKHDVPQQIADLLALIRDLTEPATHAESVAELFNASFRALDCCVRFDVGAAVMLEQHLDLYVVTGDGAEALVNERLIAGIRKTLSESIPASFASTEIVVKTPHPAFGHPLPQAGEGLESSASAVLRIAKRTAGVVILFRGGEAFSVPEQQIVEIFAAQVAMLLGQLAAREEIRNLADTDDLTGIGNKRWLRRQLPQEVERARVYNLPLSLLMFDVDDFKEINDRYGHTVGDVVLSELCGAVRESLRPPDVFARFGGDEFAVILPHTDIEGARAVAGRILDRVREVAIAGDDEETIRCSVSIGGADYRLGDSAADLLRRADERLYEAKRSGKNRCTVGE